MTDRELLELAAKAGGVEITPCTCDDPKWPFKHDWDKSGKRGHWSPLESDGDALRLAVDLNIGFRNMGHVMTASCEAGQFNEYADGDPYAATRRAIVRAAAEIGKAMP